jgi:signal transduction histidine kinase
MGDALAADGSWQLILILAAIGLLALFSRWRASRQPPPIALRELRERDGDPDRYRSQADRAIVELLETSRSLNAQVDMKIRTLNLLIQRAEEQALRLERILGEAGRRTPEGDAASAKFSAPAAAFRPGLTDLQERVLRLREAGKSLTEIAKSSSLSVSEVRFTLESLDRPAEKAYE